MFFGPNSRKIGPISSKVGIGLAENGKVGADVHLWFLTESSSTFLVNQCWSSGGVALVSDHACMFFGQTSRKIGPISSQMGIGLVENGKVGVDVHLWFLSESSWTFFCELMLKFRWCSASFWSCTHAFWPDHPQNWSDFLKNWDCLGRKWRDWSRHSSVIPS